MKAVSLIMQFTIFFVIGLGFFLLAGNLFKFQSSVIKKRIIDSGADLSVVHFSASAIRAIDSCKTCDNVTLKFSQKPIAGVNPVFQLASGTGVTLMMETEGKTLESTMHNMNYSVSLSGIQVSSSNPIDLTYDRTKNNLVIK